MLEYYFRIGDIVSWEETVCSISSLKCWGLITKMIDHKKYPYCHIKSMPDGKSIAWELQYLRNDNPTNAALIIAKDKIS